MKYKDLWPSHAKRAERFESEAFVQLQGTPGLTGGYIYNLADEKIEILQETAQKYRSAKKQRQLIRRMDQVDRETVNFTAIGIEGTSMSSQILIDLLDYLDELARVRGADEPDPSPRILELDEPGELDWLLSTVWFFR